jgi:hypothetical protein
LYTLDFIKKNAGINFAGKILWTDSHLQQEIAGVVASTKFIKTFFEEFT